MATAGDGHALLEAEQDIACFLEDFHMKNTRDQYTPGRKMSHLAELTSSLVTPSHGRQSFICILCAQPNWCDQLHGW